MFCADDHCEALIFFMCIILCVCVSGCICEILPPGIGELGVVGKVGEFCLDFGFYLLV